MTDRSRRSFLAPIAALVLVGGLVGGFAIGRVTAPSDLAALEGLLGTQSTKPAPLARGVDNDGEVVLAVDANGVLDKAGVSFIEKTGSLTLGVRNDATEPVILVVARPLDLQAGTWENVYSTRIDAGKTLAGQLALKEQGPYRITSALASAPDTLSEAKLVLWTPE